VFDITLKYFLGVLHKLIDWKNVEPESPILDTFCENKFFVPSSANIEVHSVPIEVLVLLSLELDPRYIIAFSV
jgi:hypothetical protein